MKPGNAVVKSADAVVADLDGLLNNANKAKAALRAAIDVASDDRNASKLQLELRTAIEDGVSKSSDIAAEARALIKDIEESDGKRKELEEQLHTIAEKGKAALATAPHLRKAAIQKAKVDVKKVMVKAKQGGVPKKSEAYAEAQMVVGLVDHELESIQEADDALTNTVELEKKLRDVDVLAKALADAKEKAVPGNADSVVAAVTLLKELEVESAERDDAAARLRRLTAAANKAIETEPSQRFKEISAAVKPLEEGLDKAAKLLKADHQDYVAALATQDALHEQLELIASKEELLRGEVAVARDTGARTCLEAELSIALEVGVPEESEVVVDARKVLEEILRKEGFDAEATKLMAVVIKAKGTLVSEPQARLAAVAGAQEELTAALASARENGVQDDDKAVDAAEDALGELAECLGDIKRADNKLLESVQKLKEKKETSGGVDKLQADIDEALHAGVFGGTEAKKFADQCETIKQARQLLADLKKKDQAEEIARAETKLQNSTNDAQQSQDDEALEAAISTAIEEGVESDSAAMLRAKDLLDSIRSSRQRSTDAVKRLEDTAAEAKESGNPADLENAIKEVVAAGDLPEDSDALKTAQSVVDELNVAIEAAVSKLKVATDEADASKDHEHAQVLEAAIETASKAHVPNDHPEMQRAKETLQRLHGKKETAAAAVATLQKAGAEAKESGNPNQLSTLIDEVLDAGDLSSDHDAIKAAKAVVNDLIDKAAGKLKTQTEQALKLDEQLKAPTGENKAEPALNADNQLTAPSATLATNKPLTITGSPLSVAVEDASYEFIPTVSDNADIEFSIENKPEWASFDSLTGTLAGSPDANDVGKSEGIIITVNNSNGDSTSLPAFDLVVASGDFSDDLPTISGSPSTGEAHVGASFSFTPTARKSDGEQSEGFKFAISNQPRWASFDPITGTLSGTPSSNDVGSYPQIIISVADGEDGSASLEAFKLVVPGANKGPSSPAASTDNADAKQEKLSADQMPIGILSKAIEEASGSGVPDQHPEMVRAKQVMADLSEKLGDVIQKLKDAMDKARETGDETILATAIEQAEGAGVPNSEPTLTQAKAVLQQIQDAKSKLSVATDWANQRKNASNLKQTIGDVVASGALTIESDPVKAAQVVVTEVEKGMAAAVDKLKAQIEGARESNDAAALSLGIDNAKTAGVPDDHTEVVRAKEVLEDILKAVDRATTAALTLENAVKEAKESKSPDNLKKTISEIVESGVLSSDSKPVVAAQEVVNELESQRQVAVDKLRQASDKAEQDHQSKDLNYAIEVAKDSGVPDDEAEMVRATELLAKLKDREKRATKAEKRIQQAIAKAQKSSDPGNLETVVTEILDAKELPKDNKTIITAQNLVENLKKRAAHASADDLLDAAIEQADEDRKKGPLDAAMAAAVAAGLAESWQTVAEARELGAVLEDEADHDLQAAMEAAEKSKLPDVLQDCLNKALSDGNLKDDHPTVVAAKNQLDKLQGANRKAAVQAILDATKKANDNHKPSDTAGKIAKRKEPLENALSQAYKVGLTDDNQIVKQGQNLLDKLKNEMAAKQKVEAGLSAATVEASKTKNPDRLLELLDEAHSLKLDESTCKPLAAALHLVDILKVHNKLEKNEDPGVPEKHPILDDEQSFVSDKNEDLDQIPEQEKMVNDLAKRRRISAIVNKKNAKLDGEHEAASKVQAVFRGHQGRKRAKEHAALLDLDQKAVHHKLHEVTDADIKGAEDLAKFKSQMESAEKNEHEGHRPSHPKFVSIT